LSKNLYHLAVEPKTAIRDILQKKDKSEILALLAVLTLPCWGYMVARIGWDGARYGVMMPRTGWVFQICLLLQLLIIGYLGWGLWRGRK